jgi:hypothetical protein
MGFVRQSERPAIRPTPERAIKVGKGIAVR